MVACGSSGARPEHDRLRLPWLAPTADRVSNRRLSTQPESSPVALWEVEHRRLQCGRIAHSPTAFRLHPGNPESPKFSIVSSQAVHIIRNILPGVGEGTLRELRSLVAYSLAAPRPPSFASSASGCSSRWWPRRRHAFRQRRVRDPATRAACSRPDMALTQPTQPRLRLMAARSGRGNRARATATHSAGTELSSSAGSGPPLHTQGRRPGHNPLLRGDRPLAEPKRLSAVAPHPPSHGTPLRPR